jgi:TolA-binding protein
LAQESKLLASAIAKLRRDGEPGEALAILDRHRAEFGSGALAQEANATRIEALLRLGRNGQALALLDAQSLSARGVAGEMLVARAELRADQGRYSAALRDFDQLLSGRGQPDSVTERARYGRATCRAKSADWDGARADFQQYLSEFPRGRFAERVRAALAPNTR